MCAILILIADASFSCPTVLATKLKCQWNEELSKAGNTPIKPNHPRFDKGIKNLAQGIARVKKKTFVKNFDYGTPVNIGDGNDAEGLIFYSSQSAFPSRAENAFQVQHDSSDGIALLNTTEATANCESLNVITIANSGNAPQCTAIVGNYESYHVQRWMRRRKRDGSDTGLEPVSRGQNDKGFTSFKVPENDSIEKHWKALRNYFTHLDEVVAELKLIAERVAKKNTIIVMTCNMGQSELLMNFVCNARAKSLDISNILVFPTDEGTKELAEGLGLATFYDKGVRRLIEFSRNSIIYECAFYFLNDNIFIITLVSVYRIFRICRRMGLDITETVPSLL